MTNLISNAVKFGGQHPAVVVVLERQGALARLEWLRGQESLRRIPVVMVNTKPHLGNGER